MFKPYSRTHELKELKELMTEGRFNFVKEHSFFGELLHDTYIFKLEPITKKTFTLKELRNKYNKPLYMFVLVPKSIYENYGSVLLYYNDVEKQFISGNFTTSDYHLSFTTIKGDITHVLYVK